jgi:hypothetical protein
MDLLPCDLQPNTFFKRERERERRERGRREREEREGGERERGERGERESLSQMTSAY